MLAILALFFVASVSSASVDLQKVANALNPTLHNVLQVQNGHLLVTKSGASNKNQGFEDCRQIAINLTSIDIAQADETLVEFIAKDSHRIDLSIPGQEETKLFRIMVAVRVQTTSGATVDRTYSYILDDGSNKYCTFKSSEGFQIGTISKKKVAKDYINKVIPTFPADALKAWMDKESLMSSADVAEKNISHVLKGDCGPYALNKSLSNSVKAFQDKYGQKAIPFFRLDSSMLTGEDDMSGTIRLIMTDAQGSAIMQTVTALELKDGKKTCVEKSSATQVLQ